GQRAPSNVVAVPGRWYYLVLHGLNGLAKTQQLFIYDGDTGRQLDVVNLTFDVTGTYKNQLSKWGFGTQQDATGLHYYLDDIFFSNGTRHVGAMRVVPRTPVATTASGTFTPVGADTVDHAVAEVPVDGDTTYSRSDITSTQARPAAIGLAPVPIPSTDSVWAATSAT